MKERPILFSGPMVRAILDGRKSQTRRMVNPQPDEKYEDASRWYPDLYNKGTQWNFWGASGTDVENICGPEIGRRGRCPYGIPGDRLWVRETWWMHDDARAFGPGEGNVTDADGQRRLVGYDATMDVESRDIATGYGCRKRHSLFMPRWASRLTLAVKSVRVERLQDISEADAIAEGTTPGNVAGHDVDIDGNVWNGAYRRAYAALWDSINGPGSWAANPWVWVIEFERIAT
jgi:hypothetical protein